MAISKVVGGIAVAAFIVVSVVLAGRFGWSLGSTIYDQWLYASAGGVADLLKAFLPLLIVAAWRSRQHARWIAGSCLFVIITLYSLTSSFGLAALQRNDQIGTHAAITAEYRDNRAALDRLIAQRSKINPTPVGANAEDIAQAAVDQADLSVAAECSIRGKECRRLEDVARQKREELASITAATAIVKEAKALDTKIETARKALSEVDMSTASKAADPQSAAISRLTGQTEDGVRLALHMLIAILIELGSGLGLYVVFGGSHHMRSVTVPETPTITMPDPPVITADPPAPSVPVADPPTTPKNHPENEIERFVTEQLRPLGDVGVLLRVRKEPRTK